MNHNTDPGITTAPELLLAALRDADTATLLGPGLRAENRVSDLPQAETAETGDVSPVEIAQVAYRLDIPADDLCRLADCACTANPAGALLEWLASETRPRMRRALAAAIAAVEEVDR